MKKFRTVYICDRCGLENEDPNMFREVFGNVGIPGGTTMVGNNIWKIAEMPNSIKKVLNEKIMPYCYKSSDTIVTGWTLCLKCYIKEVLLSMNNNNTDKAVSKHEKDIITTILGEMGKASMKKVTKQEVVEPVDEPEIEVVDVNEEIFPIETEELKQE